MRFLDPLALTWCAAAAVPLVLYVVRPRARRQHVSTLLFFRALTVEHQESAWLRRLKHLLSLLLTLIVIAATVAGIAGLVISPPAGEVRSVVIVIDRSASMGAVDGNGRTRVDDAKRDALARVAGLPGGTAVSVVAYDNRPVVILPRSLDGREIHRSIESIQARPVEGITGSGLHLATQIARIETPAALWHYSDAGDQADAEAEKGITVEPFCMALPSPTNVGVTAFEMRRTPMQRDKLEAFVQLTATGSKPAEAHVRVRRNQDLIAIRTLAIEAGGEAHLILPLRAGRGSDVLSVDVTAAGDAMVFDDHVVARVPPVKPIDVLWISQKSDAVTQFALQSLGQDTQVRVFAGGPDAWPTKKPVDVVVFQGWLPDTWPDGVAVIAIDPDRSLGPIQVAAIKGSGLPVEAPRATRAQHPVLYGVASGRVSLLQKSVLDADPARSGLEPLWVGPAGPLLAVGEVQGQRVVIMPFSAVESENLWRLPSYPLLIGNAIYWATQPNTDSLTGNNRRTGDLVAANGTRITWKSPEGKAPKIDLNGPGEELAMTGTWIELDHIGLWSMNGGDQGSAALLSADESRLPVGPPATAILATGSGYRGLSGDLTVPLLWLVGVTLLAESWLFHRHSVY